jgi:hypothetical protein
MKPARKESVLQHQEETHQHLTAAWPELRILVM